MTGATICYNHVNINELVSSTFSFRLSNCTFAICSDQTKQRWKTNWKKNKCKLSVYSGIKTHDDYILFAVVYRVMKQSVRFPIYAKTDGSKSPFVNEPVELLNPTKYDRPLKHYQQIRAWSFLFYFPFDFVYLVRARFPAVECTVLVPPTTERMWPDNKRGDGPMMFE